MTRVSKFLPSQICCCILSVKSLNIEISICASHNHAVILSAN